MSVCPLVDYSLTSRDLVSHSMVSTMEDEFIDLSFEWFYSIRILVIQMQKIPITSRIRWQ